MVLPGHQHDWQPLGSLGHAQLVAFVIKEGECLEAFSIRWMPPGQKHASLAGPLSEYLSIWYSKALLESFIQTFPFASLLELWSDCPSVCWWNQCQPLVLVPILCRRTPVWHSLTQPGATISTCWLCISLYHILRFSGSHSLIDSIMFRSWSSLPYCRRPYASCEHLWRK